MEGDSAFSKGFADLVLAPLRALSPARGRAPGSPTSMAAVRDTARTPQEIGSRTSERSMMTMASDKGQASGKGMYTGMSSMSPRSMTTMSSTPMYANMSPRSSQEQPVYAVTKDQLEQIRLDQEKMDMARMAPKAGCMKSKTVDPVYLVNQQQLDQIRADQQMVDMAKVESMRQYEKRSAPTSYGGMSSMSSMSSRSMPRSVPMAGPMSSSSKPMSSQRSMSPRSQVISSSPKSRLYEAKRQEQEAETLYHAARSYEEKAKVDEHKAKFWEDEAMAFKEAAEIKEHSAKSEIEKEKALKHLNKFNSMSSRSPTTRTMSPPRSSGPMRSPPSLPRSTNANGVASASSWMTPASSSSTVSMPSWMNSSQTPASPRSSSTASMPPWMTASPAPSQAPASPSWMPSDFQSGQSQSSVFSDFAANRGPITQTQPSISSSTPSMPPWMNTPQTSTMSSVQAPSWMSSSPLK